jgi:hypothetical protein
MPFGVDAAAYPISGLKNDDAVCGGGGVSEDCSGGLEAGDASADDGDCLFGGGEMHFVGL